MGSPRFTLSQEQVFEHGRLPNVHPGEILKAEVLEALGITAYQLAKALGVQQMRISEILHGKRSISADTALRLGRYLGTGPDFWLRLQAEYDRREAEQKLGDALLTIQPREAASV